MSTPVGRARVLYPLPGPWCTWIGKKDRKESVWYQCDVIFAIRWKRKKEERKEVSSCVARRIEHGSKIL